MKKYGWYGLFAVLLVACGKDTTGPSGPPDLTMKDVVGCWKYNEICMMKCFDRGGYYEVTKYSTGDLYEDSGAFSIAGYSVKLQVRYTTLIGVVKSESSEEYYKKINDRLVALRSDGSESGGYYSRLGAPDSFTCGTPWKYFSKPAGWDTLIRPLP